MHEMSICEGLRDVIEEQARAHKVERVTRVRLEIGRFASIEPEALHFAFDVVMRNSVAEGAELIVIDLPGRALCYDCMEEKTIEHRLDPCPSCGGGKMMPQGGDEMRIKDLEVV